MPFSSIYLSAKKLLQKVRVAKSRLYWQDRIRQFGHKSVLNSGYRNDDFDAITAKHREIIFPFFRKCLNGNEKVILDFGCGPGRFSEDLVRITKGKVIAMDPSRDLLNMAPPNSSVSYRLMQPGKIPLEAEFVDAIWIFQVLGGMRGPLLQRTTQELERVLKPNGLMFLVENTSQKAKTRHWFFRSVERYKEAFPGIGLQHIHDFQDLNEKVSVFGGRKGESSGKGIGTLEYFKHYYGTRDWKSCRDLLSLLTTYSEPGPILDVGAGIGLFLEAATRWGLPCQGIEGSQEAVNHAKARFPGLHLQQHFLENRFPFSDESFQAVIMNQVIEHLNEREAHNALAESFRVLKPGGFFLVFSPSRFNTSEKHGDPTHQRLLSPAELERKLTGIGFRNIIPQNGPHELFGKGLLGKGLAKFLYVITGWDQLSAFANFLAYKPPAG